MINDLSSMQPSVGPSVKPSGPRTAEQEQAARPLEYEAGELIEYEAGEQIEY